MAPDRGSVFSFLLYLSWFIERNRRDTFNASDLDGRHSSTCTKPRCTKPRCTKPHCNTSPPLPQSRLSAAVSKSIPLSATILEPLPSPTLAEPLSAPPINSALQIESPPPKTVSEVGQALLEYTEKVRVVERVGKVRLNLDPQSPSYYELDSLKSREGQLGYLTSDDASIQFKGFRGKTVRVIAAEYISKPPAAKVILKVRSIALDPAR